MVILNHLLRTDSSLGSSAAGNTIPPGHAIQLNMVNEELSFALLIADNLIGNKSGTFLTFHALTIANEPEIKGARPWAFLSFLPLFLLQKIIIFANDNREFVLS